MDGTVFVALAAAIGNMLQGWDNATIAGSVIYIKMEFGLEHEPTIEGLIVAMSLIGATIITTFSGAVSDAVGRRPMLITSSILYFLSGLLMLWSPNVSMLLLARLIYGFAIGLAVTLVPVYISETAPSDIRGTLNTLPQFTGSGGMFLSYCMVFAMSLQARPNWRLMLGVLSIPSLLYVVLAISFLPESPRWLVSKGRMVEAKQVIQRLRGREDVSEEMGLLVEGLKVSTDTNIEEFVLVPESEHKHALDKGAGADKIILFDGEENVSLVARPVTGQSQLGSALGLGSRGDSIFNRITPFVDPVVTIFGSIHRNLPETGNMRSILVSNIGSMLSVVEQNQEEDEDEDHKMFEEDIFDSDEEHNDIEAPLLQPGGSRVEGTGSIIEENAEDVIAPVGIGGGWHLAYKVTEGSHGTKGGMQRVYLHQEGVVTSRRGSLLVTGKSDILEQIEPVQAAALVSQPALSILQVLGHDTDGPAMVHPSKIVSKGPKWRELSAPGVKFALFVGIGIQILQQFSGINGVLYYTPQILEQVGVGGLLANMGLSSTSASILMSGLTTFLMLPCIVVAMALMDGSGRRSLLLATLPVLILSLLLLVLANIIPMGEIAHAVLCTTSVVVYICCFVMGFGPIPNIICSEIFPTNVRGLCIAICGLTFWFGDIIVTYSLPLLLDTIKLTGVFLIYAIVCFLALLFAIYVIPETKSLPLEIITEIFNIRAKQFGSVFSGLKLHF